MEFAVAITNVLKAQGTQFLEETFSGKQKAGQIETLVNKHFPLFRFLKSLQDLK